MKFWNSFWFDRQDPLPMAVCRVGVGLLLLTAFVVMTPNWERFYAADGMLQRNDEQLYKGQHIDWYSILNWTEGFVSVHVWWFIGIVLSLGLIIGWQTRFMTISLFLLVSSLINRNSWIVNGEDLVLRMMLFHGMFSPWGSRLSVDARLSKMRTESSTDQLRQMPLVWSWRMMQINFLLIYAISLPYKFSQEIGWFTGDAIHWTVASNTWWEKGRMPWITLAFDGWIRRGLTWGTVIVEGLAPILVWFRVTRVPMSLAIMGLHLGIAYCIPGVTLFTFSMVAGACMFLPSELYQAIATRVVMVWRRLWGKRGTAT